jgi:topoisomerase IA-like protein
MLNGIQRPDLINLLNQGKVKEFQEQIGMTTNAKDKTQKADGLFGVWTYRNVEKFVANENKKLPPKQEVKEEKTPEPVVEEKKGKTESPAKKALLKKATAKKAAAKKETTKKKSK